MELRRSSRNALASAGIKVLDGSLFVETDHIRDRSLETDLSLYVSGNTVDGYRLTGCGECPGKRKRCALLFEKEDGTTFWIDVPQSVFEQVF